MKIKQLILVGSTAALLLTTQPLLRAAPFTWDGGAVIGNNWTADNNWNPNTQPPSDGTADLTFAGTTQLDSDANNPYSIRSIAFASNAGAFTISGQTLTIGTGGITQNDDSIQTISNAIVLSAPQTWSTTNGGTLAIGGSVNTNGNLLTLSGTSQAILIGGAISGSGGLTVTGTPTVQFNASAANTYSGTTTVTTGTLLLQKPAGTNAIAGNVVIGGGASSARVTIDIANQIANTSDVTVNLNGILDSDNNAETITDLTINGGLVTGTGGSSLTISSLNMTGGVVAQSLGGLNLNGSVTINANATTASVSSALDLNGGSRTFTVADGAAATDFSIFGQISNGGITKVGLGTMRLTGAAGNLNTLTTTVTGGVLELSKTAGIDAIIGPLFINAAGTVRHTASNQIFNTADVTINGGTFDLNGFSELIDQLTMTGGSVTTATGTLTVGGSISATASGATPASIAGLLDLGAVNRTFAVADSATAPSDLTVSANISNGGIIKTGTGTLLLSGTNTYTGLTVNDGEIAVGSASAAGTGALTLNTGSAIRADTSSRTLSNVVTLGGDSTIGGSVDLTLTGAATLTGNRALTVSNTGLTTFSGVLGQDAAGRTLTKAGTGTLRFAGAAANTYTGVTTVTGGVLELGKTAGINAIAGPLTITSGSARLLADNQIADASAVTITTSGFLNMNGLNETIGSLTLMDGKVIGGGFLTLGGDVTVNGLGLMELLTNVNLGGSTRTFNVADSPVSVLDLTINGALTNGALIKTGAGALRLTAPSPAYTGATTVDAGTLLVLGNISGSATAVNSGATITGNGTIGPLSISGNANLAPGDGVGTLIATGLTLTSGAFVRFELAAPGTVGGVNDLLTINGNLTLDGTLVVTELAGFANGTYRIANYTGVLANNGLDLQAAFLSAHPGSSISTATTGQVNLNVIPEPSSAAVLALSTALLSSIRRKRA